MRHALDIVLTLTAQLVIKKTHCADEIHKYKFHKRRLPFTELSFKVLILKQTKKHECL